MNRLRKHLMVALPALLACLLLALPAAQAKPSKLKPKPKPTKAIKPLAKDISVNINSATIEQLQLLPGVGLKKAQAIVEYRKGKAFKKFKSVDDLKLVPGFGPKVIDGLRANAKIKGRSTRVPKVKPKGPVAPVKPVKPIKVKPKPVIGK